MAIERAARKLGLPAPRRMARDAKRPNLLLEIGRGDRTLLLGAHTDTVPPGAPESWLADPYTLSERGELYTGLGVADMKGAIAALLLAVSDCDLPPDSRLLLVFAADEEGSADYGMGWLCREGLLNADAAVLFEPGSSTDESWDALYLAERGSCVLKLIASGTPGHSGHPIPHSSRAGMPFISALAALQDSDLFAKHTHPLDGTPPLVNLPTMVLGGVTPWQHPETLEAIVEIRTVPGMTERGTIETVETVLRSAGLSDRVRLDVRSWGEPTPVLDDQLLISAGRRALRATIGHEPPVGVFPAATDAGYLVAAGIPTLPALGPGTMQAIHRPNEWLRVGDLELAVTLIRTLIEAYFREDPAVASG